MDYLDRLIEDDRETVKDWKVFTLMPEIVLNLFIKYRASRKTEPLKKMKEILKSMKSTEAELLSELLNKL